MHRRGWRSALALVGLALVGCGAAGPGTGPASPSGHGTVSVLYAGSLVNLMENDLGPAFSKATGYTYQGYGAGSDELVSDIKGKVKTGDVFISANPSVNQGLEGTANGGYVSWYSTFAQAPLVLGYNPKSRFAADFRSEPWYQVVTQPGILVGRTDPVLDPKGKLTSEAVGDAATLLGMPSLNSALSSWPVFPEETLVGRLEAGQLDAGFFYSFEATAQSIPTVSLSPIGLMATFTVTTLNNAPNPQGAEAFVSYLLGPSGRAVLQKEGVQLLQTTLSGPVGSVPESLRSLVGV
ncbi:MAG TPA: extracellular solute-binding protein [Candidatus Binatia bacterium]|nr:extracellular solute-binding protein [Candidatus Binatia bacterium]